MLNVCGVQACIKRSVPIESGYNHILHVEFHEADNGLIQNRIRENLTFSHKSIQM